MENATTTARTAIESSMLSMQRNLKQLERLQKKFETATNQDERVTHLHAFLSHIVTNITPTNLRTMQLIQELASLQSESNNQKPPGEINE